MGVDIDSMDQTKMESSSLLLSTDNCDEATSLLSNRNKEGLLITSQSCNISHICELACCNRRYPQLICVIVIVVCLIIVSPVISHNHTVHERDTEDSIAGNIGTDSCGAFFEPDPIMALKGPSTIENIPHGAVASDHPVCSELGKSILRDLGGNAIDAAVATMLCLGVANPASSGVGGGAFILIHGDATHHQQTIRQANFVSPEFIDARNHPNERAPVRGGYVTEVIDCREVAPRAATSNMYQDKPTTASTHGGLSIAVPGELRGLELAHARHGRLTWAAVVNPVVNLARYGVHVGAHLAHDIAENTHFLSQMEGLRTLLTKNNDGINFLQEGDIIKNPALADTLEAVMYNGADAVYKGERASSLADEIQQAGGIVTEDDISTYRATLRSPLIARDINGFTMVCVPPPSSGGAAIIGAARFLAGYKLPMSSFADTLSKHRLVEAMRHAFAIRMSLSDPAYNYDTVQDAVNDLIDGDYMENLRKSTLDNATLPLSKYGGEKWAQLHDIEGNNNATDANEGDRRRRLRYSDDDPRRHLYRRFGYLDDHGTSHLSVVDKDGNAVSITSSINTYFGSGVVSKSTGILLNDQMDDFGIPGLPNYFGLKPSEANFISPGKKPLSSMSPMLLFRNNLDVSSDSSLGILVLVVGASGGPKIISAILQVFINYAILGMPLYESIAHPRVHDQLLYHTNPVTTIEKCTLQQGPTIEVSLRTKNALENRGHQLLNIDYTGTVQAVSVDPESMTLTAVSDIRKGGSPAGY